MATRRVVVVGAGIIGAAVAARLAEGGAAVTTVEAERPGGGTTASSYAWYNANAKTPRHYYELNVRGMRAHQDLAARAGGPHWFHPVGNLEWASTEAEVAALRTKVERLRDWGYAVQVLSRRQAAELEPAVALPRHVDQYAYFPEEGYVDGRLFVEVLLARAVAMGGAVITGDPVVDLVIRTGRAAGVSLRSGRRLDADVVVLAAGWRTAELAAWGGLRVPLVTPYEPGTPAVSVLAWTSPHAGVRRMVHPPGLMMRPTREGSTLLGFTSPQVGLRLAAEPPAGAGEALLEAAREVVPAARTARIVETRLCVRPLPRDGYPIVGFSADLPGCYVAVTHSGVTLAPYLSVLVAGEILTGEPALALDPYRLDRFAPAAGRPPQSGAATAG